MRDLTYFPLLESYPKTSGYGTRVDPITGATGSFHGGVDYGAPYGAPLIAPYEGYVTTGYESGGAGNWIWVDNGPDRFKSFHHESFQIVEGWVAAGDVIAYIGSTGSSTGSHAHLELWAGGTRIDPTGYLDAAPLYGPPPEEDEMTEDDFHRIASMVGAIIDNRIDQFLTPAVLWLDGDEWFEVLTLDGCRVRRRLKAGELVALRAGSLAAEQPVVDVTLLQDGPRDAVRAWPFVDD